MKWKNEAKKEKIQLYKNKIAFIETVFDDDTSYIIRAFDENQNLVGCCYFDIEKFYRRNLTEEERFQKAKYFGGIENTPKSATIYITKQNRKRYNIQDNVLKFERDGKIDDFHFDYAKCRLQSIEIKNEAFFKTGLGSAMLKKMEEFALSEHCCEIYAHFQPYGIFAHGSRKFYDKNGFTISFNPIDDKDYAKKLLPTNKFALTKQVNLVESNGMEK